MTRLEKAIMQISLAVVISTTLVSARTILTPSNYRPYSIKLNQEAHNEMKTYAFALGASSLVTLATLIPSARRRYYSQTRK